MRLFGHAWKRIFFVLLFMLPVLCAKAAETDEEAIRGVVERYFEILSGEDLNELVEYEAISKEELLRILAAKELGMQEYQNIELPYITQSEADRTVWIVHTCYELAVDGLPPLPGAASLIVKKENGDFRIVHDYVEELPEDVVDELIQTTTRTEVVEWYLHIISQYDELVEDHGEIIDWINLCREEEKSKVLEYQDWYLSGNNDNALAGGTYTVQAGDCLWKIAGQYCGGGTRWVELYEQNRDVIGDNPSFIYPGQVLYIGIRKSGDMSDSAKEGAGESLDLFASLLPEVDIYVNGSRVSDINGDGMPELCFMGAGGWDYRVYYYLNGEVYSVENLQPWAWSSNLSYTEDGTLVLSAHAHTTGTAGISQYRIYEWSEAGYSLAEDLWRMPVEWKEGEPIGFAYISSKSCLDALTEDYSELLITQSEYEQKIEQLGSMTNLFEYGSKSIMDWDRYYRDTKEEWDVNQIMAYVREEIRNWKAG